MLKNYSLKSKSKSNQNKKNLKLIKTFYSFLNTKFHHQTSPLTIAFQYLNSNLINNTN